jgi:hypothetical protein
MTFRGRAALEKAYTEYFAKNSDNALDIEVESMRFPSKDTAVVEGHFKLHTGKKKELIVSKCSFLYAREDGKWLIAIAREWPGDGLSLRDLEWLIGTWEAKRDGTIVTTKYEWTSNRSFIRCHFSITQEGKTTTGMQMIGIGVAVGLIVAAALGRLLSGLLFGVQPADPLTAITAIALLTLVGLVATLLPSWRASRIDPVVILRRG